MATDDHMKVTAVGLPSGALSATFGRYELENGQHIEDVVLGYSTYGTLNEVRHPIDDALFTPRNARFTRFFFRERASPCLPRRARPSRPSATFPRHAASDRLVCFFATTADWRQRRDRGPLADVEQ
jgi:hypothetical protein